MRTWRCVCGGNVGQVFGEFFDRGRVAQEIRGNAGLEVRQVGLVGEGDAGDALEVWEELDGVPGGKERGEGVALAEAEFQGEEACGLEQGVGLRDEAGVEFEAGGAGEEGLRGLVVADLGVERGGVGSGNVGWV